MEAAGPLFVFRVLLERVVLEQGLGGLGPVGLAHQGEHPSVRVHFLDLPPLEMTSEQQRTKGSQVMLEGFPKCHSQPFYRDSAALAVGLQHQPLLISLDKASAVVSTAAAFGELLDRRACTSPHPQFADLYGEFPLCDEGGVQVGVVTLLARLISLDDDTVDRILAARTASYPGSRVCMDDKMVTTAVCTKCMRPKRPSSVKRFDAITSSQDNIPEETTESDPSSTREEGPDNEHRDSIEDICPTGRCDVLPTLVTARPATRVQATPDDVHMGDRGTEVEGVIGEAGAAGPGHGGESAPGKRQPDARMASATGDAYAVPTATHYVTPSSRYGELPSTSTPHGQSAAPSLRLSIASPRPSLTPTAPPPPHAPHPPPYSTRAPCVPEISPLSASIASSHRPSLAPGDAAPKHTPGSEAGLAQIPGVPGSEAGLTKTPGVPGSEAGLTKTPGVPGSETGLTKTPGVPGSGAGLTQTPGVPGSGAGLTQTPGVPGSEAGLAQTPEVPGSEAGLAQTPGVPGSEAGLAQTPGETGVEEGLAQTPAGLGREKGLAQTPGELGIEEGLAQPLSTTNTETNLAKNSATPATTPARTLHTPATGMDIQASAAAGNNAVPTVRLAAAEKDKTAVLAAEPPATSKELATAPKKVPIGWDRDTHRDLPRSRRKPEHKLTLGLASSHPFQLERQLERRAAGGMRSQPPRPGPRRDDGMEMNFNVPLPKYGHKDCVVEPTTVPPDQAWLWHIPSAYHQPRPGWYPGAIPRNLGLRSTQSHY